MMRQFYRSINHLFQPAFLLKRFTRAISGCSDRINGGLFWQPAARLTANQRNDISTSRAIYNLKSHIPGQLCDVVFHSVCILQYPTLSKEAQPLKGGWFIGQFV
jgi:hypothetical protein